MRVRKGTATVQAAPARRWKYLLYRDGDTPPEGMPLLLYLHGSGQCGNDLELVRQHWPPAYCLHIPMLVLAPQCPADVPLWEPHAVMALLDQVVQEQPVDRRRMYITGMSMGAYGMWETLVRYPDVFAAAASVCHGGYTQHAARIKHIPTWLFHGLRDTLVDPALSLRMAQALAAEEAPDLRMTLYAKADHDAWSLAYAEQDLYLWMLGQHNTRVTG